MPQDIKGTSPHKPEAAVYYLTELVKEGKMTAEEAERTEVYMIFRNARRMQDLQDVEGLSEEDRRAYMKRNVNCGEIPCGIRQPMRIHFGTGQRTHGSYA